MSTKASWARQSTVPLFGALCEKKAQPSALSPCMSGFPSPSNFYLHDLYDISANFKADSSQNNSGEHTEERLQHSELSYSKKSAEIQNPSSTAVGEYNRTCQKKMSYFNDSYKTNTHFHWH